MKITKISVLLAAMMALSVGQAQTKISKEEVKGEHDRIEETAKMEKKSCDGMKDNAKDVCEAKAKAKEKVAKADLKYRQTGDKKDEAKLADIKAEAEYEVAKEQCEDMAGAQQSDCKKQAKATEKSARDAVKAMHKG